MTESFAFRKQARLLRPQEFKEVFSKKTLKSQSPRITLWGSPRTQEGARLGIAIPKRVVSRAVDRNRLRRIIRESFRVRQGKLGSWDIVVHLRRGGAVDRADEFTAELEALWPRFFR